MDSNGRHQDVRRFVQDYRFSVFPCGPRSKQPLAEALPERSWKPYQRQFPNAGEIDTWIAHFPDSNWAIVTGAISGLLVLDIDSIEGERHLAQLGLFPPTVEVRTGKGRHLYFRHPGGQVRNRVSVLPGVDVRGDGGYVIAPGSTHPDGEGYEWVNSPEEVPIADPPAWFLQLLSRPSKLEHNSPYGLAALESECETLRQASVGSRNDALNRSAFNLGQLIHSGDLERPLVERRLEEEAIRLDTDTASPFSITEIQKTIRHGIDDGTRQPRNGRASDVAFSGSIETATNASTRAAAPLLRELKPEIDRLLNKGSTRKRKLSAVDLVMARLVEQNRLLIVEEGPTFMLADDGSLLPLDETNHLLQSELCATGINPAEQVFRLLVHALKAEARDKGRRVRLIRFAERVGNRLYVSCGTNRIAMAVMCGNQPNITFHPNGYNDILFPADAVLPSWQLAEPVALGVVRAFQCSLVSPEEVSDYTPEIQIHLLESWLVSLMMGVRPLPILVPLGLKGSGKSTLARAIVRLLTGAHGDVGTIPRDIRDFNAAVTGNVVYAIDNLDGPSEKWFADTLANAATGGAIQERQLYTNAGLFRKQITAGIIITTRTGQFAERPDVRERVLPLFFGERPDAARHADRDLFDELQRHRDGLITYLIHEALRAMNAGHQASGLPGRFQEFAAVVGRSSLEEGALCLKARERAQQLAVGDPDPLLVAILGCTAYGVLKGGASEILTQLRERYPHLPVTESGKAIAGNLRELKGALRMNGVHLREEKRKDRAYFTISRELSPGSDSREQSESSKTIEPSRMEE